MFEFCKTNTDQGNIGESFAIFQLTKMGYIVSKPIFNNNKYDLLCDKDGVISRVQVKTGTQGQTSGWTIDLTTSGGNRTINTRRLRSVDDYDLLFVLVDSGQCWLIPSTAFTNTTTINVGSVGVKSKYHEYELNVSQPYSPQPIAEIYHCDSDVIRQHFIATNGNITATIRLLNISQSQVAAKYIKELCSDIVITDKKITKPYPNVPGKRDPRPNQRKVERPSREELGKMLWEIPTSQIAKKYGMSDNGVARWAKEYGLNKPPRGYWEKKRWNESPESTTS